MGDARDKYLEPEERLVLRTDDVYQTDKDVDTLNYSDKLLEIVATFSNSGQPEGWSIQSMVGRSKRGEVALRLFAVVEPAEDEDTREGEDAREGADQHEGETAETAAENATAENTATDSTATDNTAAESARSENAAARSAGCESVERTQSAIESARSETAERNDKPIGLTDPALLSQWRFGPVRFKSRGCLAMTACASVICDMIEGLTFEEALCITPEQVKDAVGGVPWDKLHTPVFAVEAIRGLVGDWIIRQGATFSQLEALLPCDAMSPHCLMCEHCSLRAFRTDLRMDEILGQAKGVGNADSSKDEDEAEGENSNAGEGEGERGSERKAGSEDKTETVSPDEREDAGVSHEFGSHELDTHELDAARINDAAPSVSAPDSESAEDSELSPDMRELLENNALADLFDLVRDYSADSQLFMPALWADLGLVPDFTTPDDFEMFVYEYLEAYRVAHPLTRETHGKPAAEEAALSAEERTSAHGFRSATHAVGIAPSIREIMAAQRAETEEHAEATEYAKGTTGSENISGVASDNAPTVSGVMNDKTEAESEIFADEHAADRAFGDEGSGQTDNAVEEFETGETVSKVEPAPNAFTENDSEAATPANPYAGLRLPKGYEMVQLPDGQWALAPVPADRAPDRREVQCENIVALTGQYTYYLYDRTKMTDSYAHWAFLAAENNPLVTFADLVREDSRTYPRPMAQKSFGNEPFTMDAEAVEAAYEEARRTSGYEDIQRTEASNGDVYYFSTTYLSPRQAEALAEWASVERVANP